MTRDPEKLREGAERGIAQVLTAAEYLHLFNRMRRAEDRVRELEDHPRDDDHHDAGPS